MYNRDEMAQFTLQKLASIYPQNLEQEELLKEMFDSRASVSSYFTLTSVVDIKHGWQEAIIQKYVDIKRESMPPENPVSLTAEDESKLDASVVTKEIELELQAKLDKHNAKVKGIMTEEVSHETEAVIPEAEVAPEVLPEIAEEVSAPKKKKAKK